MLLPRRTLSAGTACEPAGPHMWQFGGSDVELPDMASDSSILDSDHHRIDPYRP